MHLIKYPQNKREVCLVLPPEYLRGIRFRAIAPSVQPGLNWTDCMAKAMLCLIALMSLCNAVYGICNTCKVQGENTAVYKYSSLCANQPFPVQ